MSYTHWRRSAVNSAGALRGISGNFHPKNLPMHILYYKSPGRAEKAGVHVPPWNPLERRPWVYKYFPPYTKSELLYYLAKSLSKWYIHKN